MVPGTRKRTKARKSVQKVQYWKKRGETNECTVPWLMYECCHPTHHTNDCPFHVDNFAKYGGGTVLRTGLPTDLKGTKDRPPEKVFMSSACARLLEPLRCPECRESSGHWDGCSWFKKPLRDPRISGKKRKEQWRGPKGTFMRKEKHSYLLRTQNNNILYRTPTNKHSWKPAKEVRNKRPPGREPGAPVQGRGKKRVFHSGRSLPQGRTIESPLGLDSSADISMEQDGVCDVTLNDELDSVSLGLAVRDSVVTVSRGDMCAGIPANEQALHQCYKYSMYLNTVYRNGSLLCETLLVITEMHPQDFLHESQKSPRIMSWSLRRFLDALSK